MRRAAVPSMGSRAIIPARHSGSLRIPQRMNAIARASLVLGVILVAAACATSDPRMPPATEGPSPVGVTTVLPGSGPSPDVEGHVSGGGEPLRRATIGF